MGWLCPTIATHFIFTILDVGGIHVLTRQRASIFGYV